MSPDFFVTYLPDRSERRTRACRPRIGNKLDRYYGFMEDRLDFIINYDVKCCVGRDAQGEQVE